MPYLKRFKLSSYVDIKYLLPFEKKHFSHVFSLNIVICVQNRVLITEKKTIWMIVYETELTERVLNVFCRQLGISLLSSVLGNVHKMLNNNESLKRLCRIIRDVNWEIWFFLCSKEVVEKLQTWYTFLLFYAGGDFDWKEKHKNMIVTQRLRR